MKYSFDFVCFSKQKEIFLATLQQKDLTAFAEAFNN